MLQIIFCFLAWLRGRRETPPTTEEIMKNLAISDLKKQNAAELEAKEPTGTPKAIKEGVEVSSNSMCMYFIEEMLDNVNVDLISQ